MSYFDPKNARITVTIEPGKLESLLAELKEIPANVNAAISGAINKVLPKLRTRLVRTFVKTINLQQGLVRRRIGIKKSTPQTLTGYLNIRQKKLELWLFGSRGGDAGGGGAKKTAKGVSVKIYRSGAPVEYPGYFINRGRKTHRLAIFARTGKARYPIHTKYGPSVMELFEQNPGMITTELDVSREELNKQLDSQVDRILQRRKIDR